MCVVPDPSRRTMCVIPAAVLQPVPDSLSPPSAISLHLVIFRRQIPSRVELFRTSRPLLDVLVATQFAGRCTITATAACRTGIVLSVFGTSVVSFSSISAFWVGLGASSVPTNAFVASYLCSSLPTPKDLSPAPLPVEVYLTVGVPLVPCVPLHACFSDDVLKFGAQISCASFCSDEPCPPMLEPEHCVPSEALAAPGAASAATPAAAIMHDGNSRRAEKYDILDNLLGWSDAVFKRKLMLPEHNLAAHGGA